MLEIAVFASGRGSNFEAIRNAIIEKAVPNARICVVITNKETAPILGRAAEFGIPSAVIDRRRFDTHEAFDANILEVLTEFSANFVVLAGYLKMIGRPILERYRNRIINIHPALLPSFGGRNMYGLNVHRAVLEAGVKVTGATVHLVDEEYDHGPIVAQETVRVAPDDTPESLASKVLEVEHEIYPRVVEWFAADRVQIDGRRVTIRSK